VEAQSRRGVQQYSWTDLARPGNDLLPRSTQTQCPALSKFRSQHQSLHRRLRGTGTITKQRPLTLFSRLTWPGLEQFPAVPTDTKAALLKFLQLSASRAYSTRIGAITKRRPAGSMSGLTGGPETISCCSNSRCTMKRRSNSNPAQTRPRSISAACDGHNHEAAPDSNIC
jgi:hypothetical protein